MSECERAKNDGVRTQSGEHNDPFLVSQCLAVQIVLQTFDGRVVDAWNQSRLAVPNPAANDDPLRRERQVQRRGRGAAEMAPRHQCIGGPVAGPLPAPLPLAQQTATPALAAGLPSDLLVARPDVLAAEERLRAARANIGAARAAFFPTISLTGAAGFAPSALGSLFSGDRPAWTFGPSISLPIFNGGRNTANLTVAQARENIAVATYEVTVQGAFREVADALAGRQYYAEQVAAGTRGLTAARQIARLAQLRYREGVASYLEVLDAERNRFAAEQLLIQLRRAQADNLVTLYIALCGSAA